MKLSTNSISRQIMILLLSAELLSQPSNYSGWFYLNPLPTLNGYESIRFIDQNTGIAVGGENTIISTSNAGIKWYLNYDQISGVIYNRQLYSAFMIDNCTWYATGSASIGGYTLKTTNAGQNWFNLQTGFGGTSIYFPSRDTGYLVGYDRTVSKTTNGGISWVHVLSSNYGVIDCYFMNNNTGFAAGFITGAIGTIMKTTNGGANWSLDTVSNSNLFLITFGDAYTGYTAGNGYVVKTTNCGSNWFRLGSPMNNFYSASFVNGLTGFACTNGFPGYIYKTTNGGINWNILLISQNNEPYYSIYALNSDTIYCVSDDILLSTNGGESWHNQRYDVTNHETSLLSLWFTDDLTGYVTDDIGQILKTANAGTNWSIVRNPVQPYYFKLNDIQFVNSNTGFAVGDSLNILKTTNAGANWQKLFVESSDNYELYSLCFLDEQTGIVVGTWRHSEKVEIPQRRTSVGHVILKTTNAGSNWMVKDISSQGTANFYAVGFKDQFTGFAAGDPIIYKTTNTGDNWTPFLDLQSQCSCEMANIYFVNSTTGFLVGINVDFTWGFVYKTTNAGDNWNQSPGFFDATYSIDFVNQYTGYICGDHGAVYKTTNCGENWYRLYSTTGTTFSDLHFSNLSTGYLVGFGGAILKTTNGGGEIIGVEPVSNNVPVKFMLYQNYPNPFNPTTKIKFAVPSVGAQFIEPVQLVVYDILGREVATLVNEPLRPGTYEFEWDGSQYASGIYFYSLRAGDFTQTKKMVLIK